MAVYNPIKDTSPTPPSLTTSDPAAYVFGLVFTVTAPASINGIWWWCSTGQSTNTTGDEQIALWKVTGLGTGTYVTGSVTNAGTYTANAWNFIPFSSPIALTAGQEYMAVKGISSFSGSGSNYSGTGFFFSTTGAAGYVDGPALVYSSGDPSAPGTQNLEPFGNFQQAFFTTAASNAHPPDVTTNFPNTGFHSTWYGMDVQIQSGSTGTQGVPLVSWLRRT